MDRKLIEAGAMDWEEVAEMERERTAYTPGPWATAGVEEVYGIEVFVDSMAQQTVAAVLDRDDGRGPATARLIAAAPEMVELLTEALAGEWGYISTDATDRIDELLSRIRGES